MRLGLGLGIGVNQQVLNSAVTPALPPTEVQLFNTSAAFAEPPNESTTLIPSGWVKASAAGLELIDTPEGQEGTYAIRILSQDGSFRYLRNTTWSPPDGVILGAKYYCSFRAYIESDPSTPIPPANNGAEVVVMGTTIRTLVLDTWFDHEDVECVVSGPGILFYATRGTGYGDQNLRIDNFKLVKKVYDQYIPSGAKTSAAEDVIIDGTVNGTIALDIYDLDGSTGGILYGGGRDSTTENCFSAGFDASGNFIVTCGDRQAANPGCALLTVPSSEAPSGDGTLVVQLTADGANVGLTAYWNNVLLGSASAPNTGGWCGSQNWDGPAATGGDIVIGSDIVVATNLTTEGLVVIGETYYFDSILSAAPPSGGDYDPDYQAWLDYLSANGFDTPSSAQNDIFNTRVVNLKTVGAWARTDVLYMFDATYTPTGFDENYTRVNIKDPGSFTLTQTTPADRPTFVSGSGWEGSGGVFLRTGFVPATDGVNMSGTSANDVDGGVIAGWFNFDSVFSSSGYVLGVRNALGDRVIMGNSADGQALLWAFYSNPGLSVGQANMNGHYHSYGLGANRLSYKDDVEVYNSTVNRTTLPDLEVYLMNFNDEGVASAAVGNRGIKYALFGDAMEDLRTEVYEIMTDTYIPLEGYDPDYQAWLDYLSANGFDAPSFVQNKIFNARVENLKAVGAWSRIDLLYMFDATYTPTGFTENYTRVNLKSPGDHTLTSPSAGEQPTFDSGFGWSIVAGSGDYMDTNFNPTTDSSTVFNDFGAFIGIYGHPTNGNTNSFWAGGRSSSTTDAQFLLGRSNGATVYARANGDNILATLDTSDIDGHHHAYNLLDDMVYFKDGVGLTVSDDSNSAAHVNSQISLFALRVVSPASVLTNSNNGFGIKYFAIGDAMEDITTEVYEIMTDTYTP